MIKKLISCFIFILFLSISINARAKYSNYVQAGGKSVKTSTLTTYLLMETFPSSTITVYLPGTTTLATIYSNNSGTPKTNPFTADSKAYYEFYADNGFYDIKFSGTGIISPWSNAYIALSDPDDVYNPISFGAKCDSSTNDLSALTAIKTLIGSANSTITLPKTVCRTNSISFPSNIAISYNYSGGWYPNTSNTIIIVGPEIGPDTKRYYNSLSGQGTISHVGNTKLEYLKPEYRGAVGNKIGDDSAIIQATLVDAGTITNKGTVKLASTSYFNSTQLTIPSGVTLIGNGYQSELFFENASGVANGILISSADRITLSNFRLTGSSTPTLSRGIYIVSSTNVIVEKIYESGAIFPVPDANIIAGIGTTQSSNIKVRDCFLWGNGFIASGSDVYLSAYDLVNFAPTATNISFTNNDIRNSFTSFSILMFDVTNSEIRYNIIDQNNKLGTNHTASGYGVTVYGAAGRCANIDVSFNRVKNAAGFGTYLASVDKATVHGNILENVILQQSGGPLALAGLALNDVNYADVSGGSITNSGQNGAWLSGGSFITFGGLAIKSPVGDGIRIAGTPSPTDLTIHDCVLSNVGAVGINVPVASPIVRLTLHHNIDINPTTYGIILNAAMDCTIDHNITKNPGNDAILILDNVNSARVTIDGNIADGIAANMKAIAAYGFDHIITNNIGIGASVTLSRGISLDGPCTNCIISNNRLKNFAVGIYGAGSIRNEIINNDLIGNTLPLNILTSISAASNANPVSLISSSHGLTTGDQITISGGTGNWTAINNTFSVTVTGTNTFTIPVNSTTFGALTGTVVFIGGSSLSGNRYTTGARNGTAILVLGTITIPTTEVTDNNISISKIAAGGTARICGIANVIPGVSFDILCSVNDDTGTYNWRINH